MIKYKEVGDCWEVQGAQSSYGYGNKRISNRNINTHRLVYFWCNPDVPQTYIVRHICHNPPCINPKHLIHGTKKDNHDDMMRAGRQQYKIGSISPDDLEEMRGWRELGYTYKAIADLYGYSKSYIIETLQGKRGGMYLHGEAYQRREG